MLKFEISPEDMFWQEKMLRHIKECESKEELKKEIHFQHYESKTKT